MATRNRAIWMSGSAIVLALAAGHAHGQERVQRPPQAGAEVEERQREPVLWQGAADEPAEGLSERLLTELARVELTLAIERDFDAARRALARLWLRAARASAYEGRFEVLTRIAEARAQRALELGDIAGARAALEQLLPDATVADALGEGQACVAASAGLREEERAALSDPRLVALRQRVARAAAELAPFNSRDGLQSDALAAELAGDPLLLRVHRALEEGDGEFVETLGFSAVAALARLTELSIPRLSLARESDPLLALVGLAELRAAELVRARIDQGPDFWRKRIVQAMRAHEVLSNPGTWDDNTDPPTCREPQWIEVLERLAGDPELVRESLPLVGAVLEQRYLSPRLAEVLVAALESSDPDLRQAAMQEFEDVSPRVLRPVLLAVLDHPDPAMRVFAASRLRRTRDIGVFVEAWQHPDREVRRALLGWAQGAAGGLKAEELVVLEQLARDAEADIRSGAAVTILKSLNISQKQSISADTYRHIAADPVPEIRALCARWLEITDHALMAELLGELADDPAPVVIANFDERLRRFSDPPEVLPAIVARRWHATREQGAAPMDVATLELAARGLARSAEGRVFLGRAFATSGLRTVGEALLTAIDMAPFDVRDLYALQPAELARLVLGIAALEAEQPGLEKLSSALYLALAQNGIAGEDPSRAAMLLVLDDPGATLRARLCALSVLGRLGAPELEQWTLAVLRDPRWAEHRWSDYETATLGRVVGHMDGARRNALLLAVVHDEGNADEPADFLARLFHLQAAGVEELVFAILARWFADEGPTWKSVESALRLLRRFPDRLDPELLIRAARRDAYAGNAIVVIGHLRDPRYLEVLGECLAGGQSTSIKLQAIGTLTKYLSDEAAEVLLSGVAMSDTEKVRQACFDALERIGQYQTEKAKLAARQLSGQRRGETVGRIAALLAEPDATRRAEAARAAATLGATELLPELIDLLRDPDEGVREAARAALDRLNASAPGE